ncbi:hypothetical protein AG1IA_03419 [Rhizoctonia solani AG-1 IA]|uniref:DUF262 domain-containing protein n=1 Tax=Thanatephorus cucumeris (strain AG1-IA) TaxID=983506 RepID=L8X0D7_THACA|nr:hypothetical protein AG1IA_03419 [Rhizoctonia solani AG-1 IA]
MSSDSDLTDISDYEGIGTESNKRKRKAPEYRITNALQQPNNSSVCTLFIGMCYRCASYGFLYSLPQCGCTVRIISNLYLPLCDVSIEPDPLSSWSDSKQSKLIDSILRLSTDKNGNQTRVCIDGKQRLTSVYRRSLDLKFLGGAHKDGGVSYYFQPADSSKSCRLLPDNLKRQFRNKTLICVEYRDLTGAAEVRPESHFYMYNPELSSNSRVQLGMALTTGETFQSYDGPVAKFVHKMHSQLFEENQLDVLLRLSIDRGKGFQGLARTIACIAKLPDYVHPSQVQQTKLLQRHELTEDESVSILRKSEKALNIIRDIASDSRSREIAFPLPARTSRTSPVEFCFSALLVAIRADGPGMTTAQLAQQIGDMNATMRAMYADMRSNNKVSQSFWDYINGRVPANNTSLMSSQTVVQPTQPEPEPTSPKMKKFRVNGPMTPNTPSMSQTPRATETPPTGKRKSTAVTPRSESAWGGVASCGRLSSLRVHDISRMPKAQLRSTLVVTGRVQSSASARATRPISVRFVIRANAL